MSSLYGVGSHIVDSMHLLDPQFVSDMFHGVGSLDTTSFGRENNYKVEKK